jgi:hypothetical protein
MRFWDILVRFIAVGANLDFGFTNQKGPVDLGFQDEVFAAIRQLNRGYWTGFTKYWLPGLRGITGFEQSTLLNISAPEVISVKVTAFFACWCTHVRDYSMALRQISENR